MSWFPKFAFEFSLCRCTAEEAKTKAAMEFHQAMAGTVHVEPSLPMSLNAPGLVTQPLILRSDFLVSKFPFKCNVCRYGAAASMHAHMLMAKHDAEAGAYARSLYHFIA
jgi:hypothetical protein